MQTLFHLVRHGAYALLDQALGGNEAYALSAQGRDQAGRIAAMLERSRPAAVVSSPVQRARETAELIASRLNRPVQIDPAFVEIDCAGWAGKRFTELRDDPAWRAWNRFRSTAAIPGGETMLAVQARGVAGLVRLSASYPDRELVLVSHADVIKGMLAHFLGAPLDLMHRIEIGPGSVSRVALSQDDARILAINVQP